MKSDDWTLSLSALFELRCDDALEDVIAIATKLGAGQGSAVTAAAEIAAASVRLVPDKHRHVNGR